MALSELHIITELSPDDRLIGICRQMCAVEQEKAALAGRDQWAPDCGPNHEQYEALEAQLAALGAGLTKAAPPTTLEGIRALAQLAMTFTVRTPEGALHHTESQSFADWVTLFALTSAAGKPETIPPPITAGEGVHDVKALFRTSVADFLDASAAFISGGA